MTLNITDRPGGRARRRREPGFHRDPAEDRRHGRGDGEGRRAMKNERSERSEILASNKRMIGYGVIELVPLSKKVSLVIKVNASHTQCSVLSK